MNKHESAKRCFKLRWLWWVRKTTEPNCPSFNHTHTAVHMDNDLQAKVKGSYQTVAWADMSAWQMLSMWVILLQYLAKSNWKELSDNPICSKHCSTKHTEHIRVFLVKYVIKIRTSYLLLKRNRANHTIMNQNRSPTKSNIYTKHFLFHHHKIHKCPES